MNKLAIDGGEMACPRPLSPWPHYDEDEIEAVADVMRSGKVNQWTGPHVRQFEAAFADAFGQKHAIAVFNGTVALDLALKALGIGAGDEVIVTPRSFLASTSCVVNSGATPVFADVDQASQNITPATIAQVISPRTKAIIPVHLNGWPCDMPAIMELAGKHKILVIEDCAQAHGAKITGRSVGTFGHAAAFSFCQDKIISTGGEGGLVTFGLEADWKRAWAFKDHGKDYDTVFHKQHPPGFRWLHESFGANWRMSGLQAAIGLKQLEKLPRWHMRRTEIAMRLARCLNAYEGIRAPMPPAGEEHAWYRFSFHVEDDGLNQGWNRRKLMDAINAEGIRCLEVCPEIYREKAFENMTFPPPACPTAKKLGARVALLPIHPTLDDGELEIMCEALEKVLNVATR